MARFEAQKSPHLNLECVIRLVGFRLVPPTFLFWIKAQPPTPPVEVAIDVFLCGFMKKNCAVTEFVFICSHAEDIWSKD